MITKYIRNIILMSALGAVLTGCDTTEDAYYVDDFSKIKLEIKTDTEEGVSLSADGAPEEIQVLSNVSWEVQKADPSVTWYEVEASTTKGDGTVKITAGVNKTTEGKPRTAHIIISAKGFDIKYDVEVSQSILVFTMDTSKDYPVVPETGGSVELTLTSTIAWKFNVESGSNGKELATYFTNPDDLKGDGKFQKNRRIIAEWGPNYTPEERTVELILQPQDSTLEETIMNGRPSSFVLRQAAGTLPENVGVRIEGEPTLSECGVSVSYGSKAPVEEVGVILSGNGVESRVAAPVPEGGFKLDGSVTYTLTGLSEGTRYEVRPYVISKVGETVGDVTASFTTESSFVGPRITKVDVVPSDRSVNAIITVESDCEMKTGGIYIYDVNGTEIVKYGVTLSGLNQTFECNSVDFMQPNTDYLLKAYVEYQDPRTGQMAEVTGDMIPFKTTYRIPQEDDNKPIE